MSARFLETAILVPKLDPAIGWDTVVEEYLIYRAAGEGASDSFELLHASPIPNDEKTHPLSGGSQPEQLLSEAVLADEENSHGSDAEISLPRSFLTYIRRSIFVQGEILKWGILFTLPTERTAASAATGIDQELGSSSSPASEFLSPTLGISGSESARVPAGVGRRSAGTDPKQAFLTGARLAKVADNYLNANYSPLPEAALDILVNRLVIMVDIALRDFVFQQVDSAKSGGARSSVRLDGPQSQRNITWEETRTTEYYSVQPIGSYPSALSSQFWDTQMYRDAGAWLSTQTSTSGRCVERRSFADYRAALVVFEMPLSVGLPWLGKQLALAVDLKIVKDSRDEFYELDHKLGLAQPTENHFATKLRAIQGALLTTQIDPMALSVQAVRTVSERITPKLPISKGTCILLMEALRAPSSVSTHSSTMLLNRPTDYNLSPGSTGSPRKVNLALSLAFDVVVLRPLEVVAFPIDVGVVFVEFRNTFQAEDNVSIEVAGCYLRGGANSRVQGTLPITLGPEDATSALFMFDTPECLCQEISQENPDSGIAVPKALKGVKASIQHHIALKDGPVLETAPEIYPSDSTLAPMVRALDVESRLARCTSEACVKSPICSTSVPPGHSNGFPRSSRTALRLMVKWKLSGFDDGSYLWSQFSTDYWIPEISPLEVSVDSAVRDAHAIGGLTTITVPLVIQNNLSKSTFVVLHVGNPASCNLTVADCCPFWNLRRSLVDNTDSSTRRASQVEDDISPCDKDIFKAARPMEDTNYPMWDIISQAKNTLVPITAHLEIGCIAPKCQKTGYLQLFSSQTTTNSYELPTLYILDRESGLTLEVQHREVVVRNHG